MKGKNGMPRMVPLKRGGFSGLQHLASGTNGDVTGTSRVNLRPAGLVIQEIEVFTNFMGVIGLPSWTPSEPSVAENLRLIGHWEEDNIEVACSSRERKPMDTTENTVREGGMQ
nr:unnamed protein product [Haemonchus contortus]